GLKFRRVLFRCEWEWGTDDLTSCVQYALQCFPAVCSTATAPHSDAAGQDAFNGAPVECDQDGYGSFNSLHAATEFWLRQNRLLAKWSINKATKMAGCKLSSVFLQDFFIIP